MRNYPINRDTALDIARDLIMIGDWPGGLFNKR